jgi:hypothetical protein
MPYPQIRTTALGPQTAKNYTVYPETPLLLTFPAPTIADVTMQVVLVFGQRTSFGFNVDVLGPETVAPIVYDDAGNVFDLEGQVLDICAEVGSSPPIVSPDASGYFPSIFLFDSGASAGGSPPLQPQTISVVDAGLYQTSVSPPIEFGRPVFDGGITAIAFELVGSLSGTPGPPIVDGLGLDIDTDDPLGRGIMNPNNQHEMVLEAGILLDSSAIGLGMASLSPPTLAAMYLNSGNIASSGSSCWIVQSTLHGADTDENAGFSNPGRYAGGVLAVAYG